MSIHLQQLDECQHLSSHVLVLSLQQFGSKREERHMLSCLHQGGIILIAHNCFSL